MNPSALYKKEFKQNAVIFVVPYLFLILIWIFRFQKAAWLSPQLTQLLAVCIPFAIAGAYGLQAFDLEENRRTKDFLVTKPLTLGQIVGSKYLIGLLILLPLTILWIAALLPQSFVPPDLNNMGSFWLTIFLMMVIIAYSASFFAGVLVKGPLKLFTAIAIGFAATLWVGCAWSQFTTLLLFTLPEQYPALAITFSYLFSLGMIAFLLQIFLGLAFQILRNLSLRINSTSGIVYITILILLPVLLGGATYLTRPAIRSFESLFHSIFNAEDWFIGLEGAGQPDGEKIALTDTQGCLGVAKLYGKPKIVYTSAALTHVPLQNIAWSPNGRFISFSDRHRIKIYSFLTKTTHSLGVGDLALWSRDSRRLLIGSFMNTQEATSGKPLRVHFTFVTPETGVTGVAGDLTTTARQFGWDANRRLLFGVDDHGVLAMVHLDTGKTDLVDLFSQTRREPVFFCKILPPGPQSDIFSLIVCSFGRPRSRGNKNYTVRWFDFNPQTSSISLAGTLPNCSYKDLIGSAADHSLLARSSDNGLYYEVKLARKK